MAKSGDYDIGNIYEPGYNSFKPGDGAPNYLGKKNLISAGEMGMTTNPMVADQLSELSKHLNTGASTIELGSMDMKIFDSIPKHHFDELRRKGKLAEAKLSFHAPIQDMDPSGFGEKDWEESKQKLVEKQLKDVIDRAAMIDSKGNMPVTIHSSGTFGSTFKYVDGKKKYNTLVAVDRETGQLAPIKEETKYYPGGEGGEVKESTFTVEKQLESINHTKWEDSLDEVEFQRENADRILQNIHTIPVALYTEVATGKRDFNSLDPREKEEIKRISSAATYIQEADRKVRGLFSKAYDLAKKDGDKEQLEYLNKISKNYSEQLGYDKKTGGPTIDSVNPQVQSGAIHSILNNLKQLQPKLLDTMENFAIEKASETFSNVALHSYKNYGEGAPIVSIENLYQGMGFSQGEDLKNLIEKSQERFVKKAVNDGMSKSQAEKVAKKIIGATFDVGHLNMSRAHGFNEENLKKEAEAIKKHVKHVHLTDNFGYSDVHLPIGMGNVPVQALLEALGDEGEQARKINEVGGWFEHFKTNPFPELLGGAGSQIYNTGDGPMWAQTPGFQQSYVEGYGQMLPDISYQTFGAGFSQLPSSLGGQKGQGGGRMGGGV